jgi:integrase
MKKISKQEFKGLLRKVNHPNLEEARALACLCWASAAKPSEILQLHAKDIQEQNGQLFVTILGGGKAGELRTILLPTKDYFSKKVFCYSKKVPAEDFLFPSFRSDSVRTAKSGKQYPVPSTNLRFWFLQWFNFTPVALRNNRIYCLSKEWGAAPLMRFLGSKTFSELARVYGFEREKFPDGIVPIM